MMNNTFTTPLPTMPDLFPPRAARPAKQPDPRLLKRKLGEVILGRRPFLKVYSRALRADICFVNEGLVNPADPLFGKRVITMKRLAEIFGNTDTVLKTVQKLFTQNPQ